MVCSIGALDLGFCVAFSMVIGEQASTKIGVDTASYRIGRDLQKKRPKSFGDLIPTVARLKSMARLSFR